MKSQTSKFNLNSVELIFHAGNVAEIRPNYLQIRN